MSKWHTQASEWATVYLQYSSDDKSKAKTLLGGLSVYLNQSLAGVPALNLVLAALVLEYFLTVRCSFILTAESHCMRKNSSGMTATAIESLPSRMLDRANEYDVALYGAIYV